MRKLDRIPRKNNLSNYFSTTVLLPLVVFLKIGRWTFAQVWLLL
jgi:hypothetical protein